MSYNYVQCIAFEVNTFPEQTLAAPGGVPTLNQKYVGLDDELTDARHRCHVMLKAIEAAKGLAEGNGDTLKVFMAPEFFFRGKNGAYNFDTAGSDEYGPVRGAYSVVIDRLRKMVEDSQYKDWLFVFGSIIATWLDQEDRSNDRFVINCTPVIKGGPGGATKAVVKEFKSNIDFLSTSPLRTRTGATVNRTVTPPGVTEPVSYVPALRPAGPGEERQRLEYDGLGIFDTDGIETGIEICLDHARQRLRNSPPKIDESYLRLQLIPSAGMEIRPNSVVAVANAQVFNCDGNKRSACKLVQNAASRINSTATLTDVPVSTRQNYPVPTTLFKDADAKIAVYQRRSLPASVLNAGWAAYLSNPY